MGSFYSGQKIRRQYVRWTCDRLLSARAAGADSFMSEIMQRASDSDEGFLDEAELLQLAMDAYREFHAECFWYLRPDLPIDVAAIPEIARGLRRHGGRRGFLLAARLCR